MIAAASLVVLLAAAEPSVAREAGAQTEAKSARVLFEQAEVKFNLGNFAGAASDYQAAYELDHRPALLFNVGQCYRNLGNWERARFYYRRFLTLDPRTPNRRETERLIEAMSKRLDDEQPGKSEVAAAQPPPATAPPAATAPAGTASAPPAFAPALQRTDAQPVADNHARPLYRRTWFWVGVAGVVAGSVAAGLLLSRDDQHGSLPSIDVRSAGAASSP